jgi:hypothetical protein
VTMADFLDHLADRLASANTTSSLLADRWASRLLSF